MNSVVFDWIEQQFYTKKLKTKAHLVERIKFKLTWLDHFHSFFWRFPCGRFPWQRMKWLRRVCVEVTTTYVVTKIRQHELWDVPVDSISPPNISPLIVRLPYSSWLLLLTNELMALDCRNIEKGDEFDGRNSFGSCDDKDTMLSFK